MSGLKYDGDSDDHGESGIVCGCTSTNVRCAVLADIACKLVIGCSFDSRLLACHRSCGAFCARTSGADIGVLLPGSAITS
eukprot:3933539-Rhodomonas_salina.1